MLRLPARAESKAAAKDAEKTGRAVRAVAKKTWAKERADTTQTNSRLARARVKRHVRPTPAIVLDAEREASTEIDGASAGPTTPVAASTPAVERRVSLRRATPIDTTGVAPLESELVSSAVDTPQTPRQSVASRIQVLATHKGKGARRDTIRHATKRAAQLGAAVSVAAARVAKLRRSRAGTLQERRAKYATAEDRLQRLTAHRDDAVAKEAAKEVVAKEEAAKAARHAGEGDVSYDDSLRAADTLLLSIVERRYSPTGASVDEAFGDREARRDKEGRHVVALQTFRDVIEYVHDNMEAAGMGFLRLSNKAIKRFFVLRYEPCVPSPASPAPHYCTLTCNACAQLSQAEAWQVCSQQPQDVRVPQVRAELDAVQG
jgi:hypothetical protein